MNEWNKRERGHRSIGRKEGNLQPEMVHMPRLVNFPSLMICFFLLVVIGGASAKTNTLKAGVPAKSPNPKFVSVKCNDTRNETCFSGHSINVFRMVWKNLNYSLNRNMDYEFIPYNGPYDDLVKQVPKKRFDLVVGDTSILAKRCEYVEFSRPYTEVGARMVVAEKRERRAWIFIKPFTEKLWGVTAAVFIYNALIVWSIETAYSEDKHFFTNVADLGWLILTTLFPVRGEKLNSNLSRMVMFGWLFLALVLLQSYTASLTSMLTLRRLRPSVVDVETLLKEKAMVGCDSRSFMCNFLQEELKFDASCIQQFNTSGYARALSNGTVKAAFLENSNLQIFLDENPKGFIAVGPTYEIGGHAFVFPKGSLLVEPVSLEILKLREKGVLRNLEQALLSHRHGWRLDVPDDDDQDRLRPDDFSGVFLITVSLSTLILLLFLVGRVRKKLWRKVHPLEFIVEHPGLRHPNRIINLRNLRRCSTI